MGSSTINRGLFSGGEGPHQPIENVGCYSGICVITGFGMDLSRQRQIKGIRECLDKEG